MKKIAILGSTGSIGTQTLEIVREQKDIEVLGLAAANNIALLEKQIREFMPKIVAVWTEEKAKELRDKVDRPKCESCVWNGRTFGSVCYSGDGDSRNCSCRYDRDSSDNCGD